MVIPLGASPRDRLLMPSLLLRAAAVDLPSTLIPDMGLSGLTVKNDGTLWISVAALALVKNTSLSTVVTSLGMSPPAAAPVELPILPVLLAAVVEVLKASHDAYCCKNRKFKSKL